MSNGYKTVDLQRSEAADSRPVPTTDRTINDLNRANRDAWDSGEFKHSAADAEADSGHLSHTFAQRRAHTRGPEDPLDAAADSPRKVGARTKKILGEEGPLTKEQTEAYTKATPNTPGHHGRLNQFPKSRGGTAPETASMSRPSKRSPLNEDESATDSPSTRPTVHLPRRSTRQWRKRNWE